MDYKIIIIKKNIKNIIFKIKKDGNLYISAPKFISKKYLNFLIEEKEEWITKKILEIQKKFPKNIDKFYKNGDNIMYIGNFYSLFFEESKNKNHIFYDHDLKKITIYTSKGLDREHIDSILEKWYRKMSLNLFESIIKKYELILNTKINKIKVRKMKNKWGICRVHRKEITFNLELIKKPLFCIEYVCLHELSHLFYPHHKKEFWDFLSKFMPDWKYRKDVLNKNE